MNPPRTTSDAVVAVLLDDYDKDAQPDLTPYIATASAVVDRVVTVALDRGVTLSGAEAELIERWLSAHYYVCSDQTLASSNTAGASGSFHGKTEKSIESSRYGQAAINMDYSGVLNAISGRRFASGFSAPYCSPRGQPWAGGWGQ